MSRPKKVLHVHHDFHKTFCGMDCSAFLSGEISHHVECLVSANDLFGARPRREWESICPKCEITDEYRDYYGFWMLGEYA